MTRRHEEKFDQIRFEMADASRCTAMRPFPWLEHACENRRLDDIIELIDIDHPNRDAEVAA